MAASPRLSLIRPHQLVFISATAIFLLLVLFGSVIVRQLSQDEHAVLENELQTLVHARSFDLLSGNFREFVESSGPDLSSDFFQVQAGTQAFAVGERSMGAQCAVRGFHDLKITLCRKYPSPKWLLLSAVLFFGLCCYIAMRISKRLEQRSVAALADLLTESGVELGGATVFPDILSKLGSISESLRVAKENAVRLERSKVLAEVATQVAHDIRSPLAALAACSAGLENHDSDAAKLLVASSQRIRDIAEDLLSRSEVAEGSNIGQTEFISVNFAEFIEELIAEKRAQFVSRPKVQFKVSNNFRSSADFKIPRAKLSRAFSNLLNNAVEAIDGPGSVCISFGHTGGSVYLTIEDSGRGIKPEIVSRIGERGFTIDKRSGSGYGVHYAKQVLEGLRGTLAIYSDQNGTKVSVTWPLQR